MKRKDITKDIKIPECGHRVEQRDLVTTHLTTALYDNDIYCSLSNARISSCDAYHAIKPQDCPCFVEVDYLDDEACMVCNGTKHLESETHNISFCVQCGNTFSI